MMMVYSDKINDDTPEQLKTGDADWERKKTKVILDKGEKMALEKQ